MHKLQKICIDCQFSIPWPRKTTSDLVVVADVLLLINVYVVEFARTKAGLIRRPMQLFPTKNFSNSFRTIFFRQK